MTTSIRNRGIIGSRNHHSIRRIRALHSREERERTGLFYVEGMRAIAQAFRHNAQIETVVVCPPLLANPFAIQLARKLERAGTPTLSVSPEVLYSIALVDDPQGIGAVIRQKWLALERVKLGGKLCWIACEGVQSPGNLGTILRTSEAVGGAGVILFGDSADPYDPATVRASMGALFSQRFVRTTPEEFAAWKEARGWLLVGTSPSATTDYRDAAYTEPTVLLVGSERKGLSAEVQALCNITVRIPMVGHGDSLNVAVAAGVMLYELFRRKRGP